MQEKPIVLKKPPPVKFPRRLPSVGSIKRQVIYITADKTTCLECPCFQDISPYEEKPKLRPCLQTPLTLYELAEMVVDSILMPDAFSWSVDSVAKWMEFVVGFPQYKECMVKNHINGLRLLMFEDISRLPKVNIHDFDHIKIISAHIRKLYNLEVVKFFRSIGLPARLPLTYCTWFSSRTGPRWGIRKNWSNCDILRWMKIIGPRPTRIDHWDLVWYEKPEFPKTLLARRKYEGKREIIARYRSRIEFCNEYQVPRQFTLTKDEKEPADKTEMIWISRQPWDPEYKEKLIVYKDEVKPKKLKVKPAKMDYSQWTSEQLILAKRKMPKPKFFKEDSMKKKK